MRAAAILGIAGAGILAGCGWSQNIGERVAPDTVSLADRCGQIMKMAMPFAEIDIGERISASSDVRTVVAKVAGTRTDMAGNTQLNPDLAVECTYVDNVLSAFRWTKGGPPQ